MKLLHLLGFTKELVTRLNVFVCVCVLDRSRFFKEPAGIACYAFEDLVEVAFYYSKK